MSGLIEPQSVVCLLNLDSSRSRTGYLMQIVPGILLCLLALPLRRVPTDKGWVTTHTSGPRIVPEGSSVQPRPPPFGTGPWWAMSPAPAPPG